MKNIISAKLLPIVVYSDTLKKKERSSRWSTISKVSSENGCSASRTTDTVQLPVRIFELHCTWAYVYERLTKSVPGNFPAKKSTGLLMCLM